MSTYTDTYSKAEEEDDSSSMSFLDHLDELRKRLIRIAIFILAAFVICWLFSDKIYSFLQVPVKAALDQAKKQVADQVGGTVLPLAALPDGSEATFAFPADAKSGSGFIPAGTPVRVKIVQTPEGTQLVVTTPTIINELVVIPEGYVIPGQLYAPSNSALSKDDKLIVNTVQGAFNLYLKVSFYAAIFFAVPFILTQAWGFIAPGLYPNEKRYALPFIIMSSFFFLAGCAFAYYIAFPRAANFLLGVAAGGDLKPLVAAEEYFDLIIVIMLGLGLVFEMPTITYFLSRIGLITPRFLIKIWRPAMVVILIIAALLSPTTDIPNLLVFAAPMLLLYGLSIGIAWLFHKEREAPA